MLLLEKNGYCGEGVVCPNSLKHPGSTLPTVPLFPSMLYGCIEKQTRVDVKAGGYLVGKTMGATECFRETFVFLYKGPPRMQFWFWCPFPAVPFCDGENPLRCLSHRTQTSDPILARGVESGSLGGL